MAQITLTLNIPDSIIERVRTETARITDFTDYSDDLWEDAEQAVIDEVRASFTPSDLLEDAAE